MKNKYTYIEYSPSLGNIKKSNAHAELYEEFFPIIFAKVLSYVDDFQEANTLVEKVFLQLFNNHQVLNKKSAKNILLKHLSLFMEKTNLKIKI